MNFTRFDKDTFIESLPITVYRELVDALNKDSAWMILANHVAELLEYPSTVWVQSLKHTKADESPGQKLLTELNIKMCTVEMLYILLSDCNLLNILSIISDPEPLQIIVQPTDELENSTLGIPFGRHLCLYCTAIGMPSPSYLWYHEDVPLQDCTSSQLDIIITNASQAGEYKCKVIQLKNDGTLLSSLISKVVTVQVQSVPVTIEIQPEPLFEVKNGESFTIYCKANGYPEPHYQWFHGNVQLKGKTSNALHIKQFSSKHEGKYYCYVRNDLSECISRQALVMMDYPKLKAAAKIALIIANQDYMHQGSLKTPKNDAAKIANLLKELDFEVICLMNLTIGQMRNAIKLFSEALVEGVYGLFYFAGHGFKMQECYMLAIDSPEIFLRKDAICESELLAAFLKNDPELLIIILDMCQTLPSEELNPDIYREIPIVHEYKNLRNLIKVYSTSSYRPSYEKPNKKHGFYMTHLGRYITKDIPVTRMFDEVRKSVDSCFKGKLRNQIPEVSSMVTQPFRLTDAIDKKHLPGPVSNLKKITSFPTETLNIPIKQINATVRIVISLFMESFLNVVKLTILDLPNMDINFYNENQDLDKKECWIQNPQTSTDPIISISKNGTLIGTVSLHIKDHLPLLLRGIRP